MSTTIGKLGFKSKVMAVALVILMAVSSLFVFHNSAALAVGPNNKPDAVDGRILPASILGDTSDWVELARNGNYSLIVRRTVLPVGQVVFDTRNIDAYQISSVRDIVNNWFKNTLPANARLRNYTMQNNSISDIGYFAVTANGYSAPTDVQMRTGNDVAFLLSFAEAASFCSTQYATSTTTFSTATQIAKTNFNKLYFPNGQGVYMKDFWWLRSGGTNAGSSKTASSVGTHGQGMISTVYASSSQAAYPYVRPALWVNSGVFNTTGTIIVQYVYADPDDGYLISTDTFTVPTGSYGPYLPKDYSLWFERAVWDKTSAPISGTIGLDQTITIRYLYYQE